MTEEQLDDYEDPIGAFQRNNYDRDTTVASSVDTGIRSIKHGSPTIRKQ